VELSSQITMDVIDYIVGSGLSNDLRELINSTQAIPDEKKQQHMKMIDVGALVTHETNKLSSASFPSINGETEKLVKDFNATSAMLVVMNLHVRGYMNTDKLIDSLVWKLVSDERIEEAVEFIKLLAVKQAPILSKVYTKILKGLNSKMTTGDTTPADEFTSFVTLMEENGYSCDEHQYFQKLHFASKVGNLDLAKECVAKLGSNYLHAEDNKKIFLLKTLLIEGRKTTNYTNGELVVQLFKEVDSMGTQLDYMTIANTIWYAVRTGLDEEIEESILSSKTMKKKQKFIKILKSCRERVALEK